MHLGDIVELKKPYKPTSYEEQCYEMILNCNSHLLGATMMHVLENWVGFTHGIVVQILNKDSETPTRIRLHLYEQTMGLIYLACADEHPIPTYVDFDVSELEVVKTAKGNI